MWRFEQPRLAVASTVLGGGFGLRRFVVNAQVPSGYARRDAEPHLRQVAAHAGCRGAGVGFLTAAPVESFTQATSGPVHAFATVGLRHPTWAAAPDPPDVHPEVGTINLVVFLPVRCTDAALVNAVMTATEAKTQALVEDATPGTGTASDAICLLVPPAGLAEPFTGPRSPLGAHLARAVHRAVAAGLPTRRVTARPGR